VPTHDYRLASGQRVPGVTTIISYRKESGGLVHAAWKLGMEGKNYREIWRGKADAGSVAHAMIEYWLDGKPVHDCPSWEESNIEVRIAAEGAFSMFSRWAEDTKLLDRMVEKERPMVSERHGYGGTPDLIVKLGASQYEIVDWKTGSRLYSDHLVQVAAYRDLFEETNPGVQVAGYHLCRFPREGNAFHHSYFNDLHIASETFHAMRRIFELGRQLQRIKS